MASANNKRVVVANGATHDCTGLITTAPGAHLVQHLLIACFGDGLCGYRALAKVLGVPVSEVLGWFIKALEHQDKNLISYIRRSTWTEKGIKAWMKKTIDNIEGIRKKLVKVTEHKPYYVRKSTGLWIEGEAFKVIAVTSKKNLLIVNLENRGFKDGKFLISLVKNSWAEQYEEMHYFAPSELLHGLERLVRVNNALALAYNGHDHYNALVFSDIGESIESSCNVGTTKTSTLDTTNKSYAEYFNSVFPTDLSRSTPSTPTITTTPTTATAPTILTTPTTTSSTLGSPNKSFAEYFNSVFPTDLSRSTPSTPTIATAPTTATAPTMVTTPTTTSSTLGSPNPEFEEYFRSAFTTLAMTTPVSPTVAATPTTTSCGTLDSPNPEFKRYFENTIGRNPPSLNQTPQNPCLWTTTPKGWEGGSTWTVQKREYRVFAADGMKGSHPPWRVAQDGDIEYIRRWVIIFHPQNLP